MRWSVAQRKVMNYRWLFVVIRRRCIEDRIKFRLSLRVTHRTNGSVLTGWRGEIVVSDTGVVVGDASVRSGSRNKRLNVDTILNKWFILILIGIIKPSEVIVVNVEGG